MKKPKKLEKPNNLSPKNPTSILGKKGFWPSAFSLLFVLGIVLIVQFNSQTKEIYALKSCKESINTLSNENESLEIRLAKTNLLEKVSSFTKDNNFEKANSVKYVKIAGNAMAINQ